MKQYDHEPTIAELVAQLEKEYAYAPDFVPDIKIPIIGKIIKKKINKAMVDTFVYNLFT